MTPELLKKAVDAIVELLEDGHELDEYRVELALKRNGLIVAEPSDEPCTEERIGQAFMAGAEYVVDNAREMTGMMRVGRSAPEEAVLISTLEEILNDIGDD